MTHSRASSTSARMPTSRRMARSRSCRGFGAGRPTRANCAASRMSSTSTRSGRSRSPAVSGVPRNCAESGIKYVGVIGVDSGWEIYVAGNGGIKTEVAQFLVRVKTGAEVLEYAGAFLQLYREEGWYLERTVHYVARVG